VFETSGFLTASDCELVPEVGEWQFGNPAFFDELAPLSSVIDGLKKPAMSLEHCWLLFVWH
jgi:hypothetical protein